MVDLGGSVGSLTWVVEIIAKSSGFKRYRGKKKKKKNIKSKAGRVMSIRTL